MQGMIEKIDIKDASVIDSIMGKLNIRSIRDSMFPKWSVTLQPGEEYNLDTTYYGLYMIRWGDAGTTALFLIGAGVQTLFISNNANLFSIDFDEIGKIVMNKKMSNGTVFVKNTRTVSTNITIMQITNY